MGDLPSLLLLKRPRIDSVMPADLLLPRIEDRWVCVLETESRSKAGGSALLLSYSIDFVGDDSSLLASSFNSS